MTPFDRVAQKGGRQVNGRQVISRIQQQVEKYFANFVDLRRIVERQFEGLRMI
jgi:hypothetical protein